MTTCTSADLIHFLVMLHSAPPCEKHPSLSKEKIVKMTNICPMCESVSCKICCGSGCDCDVDG